MLYMSSTVKTSPELSKGSYPSINCECTLAAIQHAGTCIYIKLMYFHIQLLTFTFGSYQVYTVAKIT